MKRLFIILALVSSLPLINLMSPGIMNAHDAPDHVARIANFYQSLSEGIIAPRWAGNLNWGFGHPILMFLYPLPSYAASLFHVLGFSFVDSVKLVFGVSYIASVLAFFLWARLQWNPYAGFVGAVLYGFAPYRFVDLYVRGALGEHVAFVFGPLTFLGLLMLARNKNRWSGVIVSAGVAGLLLSHNAVSLMMVPLVFLYVIYLFIYEAASRRTFIVYCLLALSMGFAASAFFWMPAFFEGKYTLRDIVTKGEFTNRFVPWVKFFYSPWDYGGSNSFSKEVGVAQWIAVAMSIVLALSTLRGKQRIFLQGALLAFATSLFIQTAQSGRIWEVITLLAKFQFPWRFLTVSVFLTAILAATVVAVLSKKHTVLGWVLVGVAIISTFPMWKAKGYLVYPETYYNGIYNSTTDTGESSPIWSVRFMEQRAEAPIALIDGDARIQQTFRSSTIHEYEVHAKTKSRIVENTLYFPGWRVMVDEAEVPVEFQDPAHRGLMTFMVAEGYHKVRIEFGQTKLRRTADGISLAGLFTLLLATTIQLWTKRKK